MALVGTLVHHRSTSVRAEVTKMFWKKAGAHRICPEVHYPVPEFANLAGGDWVHRIARALAALGVGLYNPIACPRAAHVQLQSPPGNIVTLRTAKLRQRDTCRLTVPHTTPWHGHHGPRHPFPDNDDPWPTAVQECLNKSADEHLHYCCREQEPTNHPVWRDALVHLFHTIGTRDTRLRLVHPTRAKQEADTGPRVTPDGLHLHVGGYCRRDDLSPPTRGAAYHPLAALMYMLRDVLAESEHQEPNTDVAWPEPLRPRPHALTPLWLVTTDDQCTQASGQAQLRAEWVIVQAGAGQPEPRGLPRGTALLVARGVPHDPHMAVHALEDQPEDTGHLVVHQRGGPARLKEHVTALRSWASTITGAEIRLHDHPAISPGDTRALSVDQLTPSHPDVQWHSADLNAWWLSPTGYYWIPEAWGHTSSDASGGRPCKHATSVALAADLTRTWAVAISGTVPDREGVAASLPLQYGAHRPWLHTVDAEIILHLLRHADRERTTGVPAGVAKVVSQMPLRWLRDSLCAREQHAGHPFWYLRATSHHSDALLHKADWAASQDTVLQNTPPDPGHAELIVASRDGHLDLRPLTIRALGEVAQRAQTDHALTHRGHTPLGAAHATATNRRALRARDGHTPVQRRLRVRKEQVSGVATVPQPCLLCGGPEETPVHMHVGCAHSQLLWPHYRQAVHEAARHLPPGDKALWVASWRSAGATWTEVFCSGLVPGDAEAQLRAIARYDPPGGTSVDDFLHHMLRLGDFAWELRNHRLKQLLREPQSAAARAHRWLTAAEGDHPPPPPRPDKDFVASLRVVNGTLECPPQEGPQPYRDLPGGFSRHLQDALFPPWIIGRGSMPVWEARIVGEEWAREWGRWCATTCAPETPAQRYAAIPLKGWGPDTRPRPTMIRGAGPDHPWDVATGEWLQAAPGPQTGWTGDVSSLVRTPIPPCIVLHAANVRRATEIRTWGHAAATVWWHPSRGRGRPARRGALQSWGAGIRRRFVPAGRHPGALAPHAPHRHCSHAALGAGRLRRAASGMGGNRGRHPAGPPPPRHRERVPMGCADACCTCSRPNPHPPPPFAEPAAPCHADGGSGPGHTRTRRKAQEAADRGLVAEAVAEAHEAHAAARCDLTGSARAFLNETALPAVRALNGAGAPTLLPAMHLILNAVQLGLISREAALYGHWMEWRESNRSGRPLSMGDTLRLTGAGSAMSLRSSAPALLHALRTRYVPGGSVRAGCGAPPSTPTGRVPGGGRDHGVCGMRGRGVRPPPADQPSVRRHQAYPPLRHRMQGVPQGAHLVPRPPAGDARAQRLG